MAEIFDLYEVANILEVTTDTMFDLINDGVIRCVCVHPSPSFTWSQIERYLSERDGISTDDAQQYIADVVFSDQKYELV